MDYLAIGNAPTKRNESSSWVCFEWGGAGGYVKIKVRCVTRYACYVCVCSASGCSSTCVDKNYACALVDIMITIYI